MSRDIDPALVEKAAPRVDVPRPTEFVSEWQERVVRDILAAVLPLVRRAPVVDREALAEWWLTFDGPAYPSGAEVADALLASGLVQDAADVRRAERERVAEEVARAFEARCKCYARTHPNHSHDCAMRMDDAARMAREVGERDE